VLRRKKVSAIDEKEFLQAIEDDDLISIRTDIVNRNNRG